MRRLILSALLFLLPLTSAACAPYSGPAPVPYAATVHIDLFYDALAPYGDWILLEPHGWVWIPTQVGPHWRPYTLGHWVYTTYGWTWVSDWPWGWAPFHYGHWLHHAHHGWVWIPGRVWAPAWVAWRHGDGWLGWAPLPPGIHWRVGFGLDLDGVDLTVSLGSSAWVFIPEQHLLEPRLGPYIVAPQRHDGLLKITRDITHYRAEDRWAVEHGLPREQMEGILKRPIPCLDVEDLRSPGPTVRPRGDSDELKIYRPEVRPDPPRREPRAPKTRPRNDRRGKGG